MLHPPKVVRVASRLRWRVPLLFISISISVAARATAITVNSSADAGGTCPGATCTLRQAILVAGSGDTIDFAAGLATIDLTSAELLINKNLNILGPGANQLTIRRVSGSNFRIVHVISGSIVTLSGVAVSNGFAFGGINGGGIANEGTLTLTACTISGNTAGTSSTNSGEGGGISNTGVLSIANSTISDNSVSHGGGGIFNGGTATLTNCTISGNISTTFPGGGISNSVGTVTLTNCTVLGNKTLGSAAGGIYNDGTVNLKSTIVAKSEGPDVSGTLTSQGYNLIGVGDGATITPAQSTDQIGSAASPIDPVAGPLQDNGGPTFTHALLPGSPAQDKGQSSGVSTDQRGFPRPADNPLIPNAAGGDGSDIGAFERQDISIASSVNLSTRARVQTGDNVLIGGFIVTGNVPKPVVLRALGPSLVNVGVPTAEVLNDPVLELRGSSGALITSNDNWKESPDKGQIEGTPYEPVSDREAVIRTTLPPATYTAVVRGKDNGTGVAVVELYDLDKASDSTLANISSRAFVEAGNNVLIGGFTLGGNNGSAQIVIRAIGPSLANFGFTNPLADPTLELRDANAGLLAFNDNWRDDAAQASYLTAVGLQPKNDFESALAVTLPPGVYTGIVAGKNAGTGVGLVEIYNLQ